MHDPHDNQFKNKSSMMEKGRLFIFMAGLLFFLPAANAGELEAKVAEGIVKWFTAEGMTAAAMGNRRTVIGSLPAAARSFFMVFQTPEQQMLLRQSSQLRILYRLCQEQPQSEETIQLLADLIVVEREKWAWTDPKEAALVSALKEIRGELISGRAIKDILSASDSFEFAAEGLLTMSEGPEESLVLEEAPEALALKHPKVGGALESLHQTEGKGVDVVPSAQGEEGILTGEEGKIVEVEASAQEANSSQKVAEDFSSWTVDDLIALLKDRRDGRSSKEARKYSMPISRARDEVARELGLRTEKDRRIEEVLLEGLEPKTTASQMRVSGDSSTAKIAKIYALLKRLQGGLVDVDLIPEIKQKFLLLLKDTRWAVRSGAVAGLRGFETSDPETVILLKNVLADPNENIHVKKEAISTLKHFDIRPDEALNQREGKPAAIAPAVEVAAEVAEEQNVVIPMPMTTPTRFPEKQESTSASAASADVNSNQEHDASPNQPSQAGHHTLPSQVPGIGGVGGGGAWNPQEKLELALRGGDPERVKQAIANGANPDRSFAIDGEKLPYLSEGEEIPYCLYAAAKEGKNYTAILEMLLNVGKKDASANANESGPRQVTLLIAASAAGDLERVEMLLGYGAKMGISARIPHGDEVIKVTPEQAALDHGHEEISRYLAERRQGLENQGLENIENNAAAEGNNGQSRRLTPPDVGLSLRVEMNGRVYGKSFQAVAIDPRVWREVRDQVIWTRCVRSIHRYAGTGSFSDGKEGVDSASAIEQREWDADAKIRIKGRGGDYGMYGKVVERDGVNVLCFSRYGVRPHN